MGQAASKATTEASKAAVKRRTLPQVSNTNISRTVMEQQQQQKDSNVKMPPPASASAFDSVGSFIANTNNRAQQHQADTARRIAHAASSRSSPNTTSDDDDDHQHLLELPPDLLKFLNDAGPVTRTIDKQLTSPRVYDSLVKDENMVREHARQANTRVRRRMPIVSSSTVSSRGDGNGGGDAMEQEEMDGTMTERTTNFSSNTSVSSNRSSSSSALSSSYNNYLAVSRHDFFDLSIKLQGVTVDSLEWKKVIHDQYEDMVKKNDAGERKSNSQKEGIVDSSTTKGGFDQLRDLALLENSARFIGVPVLMKDTEGDIIGMWHSKVMDMKHSLGLKAVRENSLQFVMQNEGGVKGGM